MLGLAGARPNLPSIWCSAQWRVGRISASVIRRIAASPRRRRVTAKTPNLARPLLRPHPEEVQRRHVCLRCTVSKDGGGPDRGGLVFRDASRRDIVHRYGCAGLHAAMLLRPYVPSLAGATHPRCGCEGYPDRPGRASSKEGESWAIIAKLS